MGKPYHLCVFFSRLSPPHIAHVDLIRQGLDHADKVIVFIGSATGARRPRNPWTFQERADMLSVCFTKAELKNIIISGLPDHPYNDDAWLAKAQAEVAAQCALHGFPKPAKIALIGRKKDSSSYYLDLFPQWESIDAKVDRPTLDATAIRKRLFENNEIPVDLVHDCVSDWMQRYMTTPEFKAMQKEWAFIEHYKKMHDSGPYHRNNVTADAVVVQAGHVLLVRRKSLPGMGKLALPGGHIERREEPIDAAVRELREETGIKIPVPVLYGSIADRNGRVFSNPYRSDLARTYTHAFLFQLKGEGNKLAKVRGGSDAESAFWKPISEVVEHEMFDDHFHIINTLLGLG